MFKVIAILSLISLAVSDYSGQSGHYVQPKYDFEYSVSDPHTHDSKKQHETRHGDVVKGYYTLHEADGTVREVHYTADHKNGFNAEVHRSGHAQHPKIYVSSSETFYDKSWPSSGVGSHGLASSTNNNNQKSYKHHY